MDLSLVNPGVSLSNLWFTQVHIFPRKSIDAVVGSSYWTWKLCRSDTLSQWKFPFC